MYGGQADHDDGLGIDERDRRVQLEVQRGVLRKAQAGDVLVFGRVQGADQMDQVHHGPDVGGVDAAPRGPGSAGGVDEIRRGTGG